MTQADKPVSPESYWRKNLAACRTIVDQNAGPKFVTVVTGTTKDQSYWKRHFSHVSRDIFNEKGEVQVTSVCEHTRKGNFLGTFNAWRSTLEDLQDIPGWREDIGLMSMVFGQGKRLSPFTQALGNRKPALPTPFRGQRTNQYLTTADLANFYTGLWIRHMRERGFKGIIVKWGDEAIIPGRDWTAQGKDLENIDALRFVWQTEITEELAREKEWVLIDAKTHQMKYQFSRQEAPMLARRIAEFSRGDAVHQVGVNLGSLAISYPFLEAAMEVLGRDIQDDTRWADWDPYAWIALCCRSREDWEAEKAHEQQTGGKGIAELESRYPDFYDKMAALRAALEAKTGRPLTIGVLDFGKAYWVDMGLHTTLRKRLEELIDATSIGEVSRTFFGLDHQPDERGNFIIESDVPAEAQIYNSLIVGSVITDPQSVVEGAVIIGGRHRLVNLPFGGAALFCASDELTFSGPHAVAIRGVAGWIRLEEGGRYTSLLLPDKVVPMVASESVTDFKGDSYDHPILGNSMSFAEAGELMSQADGQELEEQWQRMWEDWLKK